MGTAETRGEWVGRVVDERFTLIEWLAGTDSSDVFLTQLPENPSQKAVIKLSPADIVDTGANLTPGAEAATLSHPNLIRTFHTGRGQVNGVAIRYWVTEFSEEALSQILPERPLTAPETREMLNPVIDALSYLHSEGFVHAHLKPSNILVVDNQLKLSSDGILRVGERDPRLTAPGVYDAPEISTGPVSPAADIWSLGVTLVEALTQHAPVWDRSANVEPALPAIPKPFAGIVQECLRVDPARRSTLNDIKARLEPVPSLPGPAREIDKGTRARFPRWALVGALIILFAVGGVFLTRSHHNDPALRDESQPVVATTPMPQQAQTVKDVSTKGVSKGGVAQQVLPNVIPSASRSIHGTINVRVRTEVDLNGKVSNATLDSAGPSKYFARVALEAAQRWRFNPAQVNGKAVPSVWLLRFQYRQSGTEVVPEEVTP